MTKQDPQRMTKNFRLSPDAIESLADGHGYCFATDRITVDGAKVGYMYREDPDFEDDSGWRFFAGDESQEYADDPANTMIYDVNEIANYDREIIPHLDEFPPCEFQRETPTSPLLPILEDDIDDNGQDA
jgi:hypothetical protein